MLNPSPNPYAHPSHPRKHRGALNRVKETSVAVDEPSREFHLLKNFENKAVIQCVKCFLCVKKENIHLLLFVQAGIIVGSYVFDVIPPLPPWYKPFLRLVKNSFGCWDDSVRKCFCHYAVLDIANRDWAGVFREVCLVFREKVLENIVKALRRGYVTAEVVDDKLGGCGKFPWEGTRKRKSGTVRARARVGGAFNQI